MSEIPMSEAMTKFTAPTEETEEQRDTPSIDQTVNDLNLLLAMAQETGKPLEITAFGNVEVGIAAGDTAYSTPRSNGEKKYTEVELRFPNIVPPDYILEYMEQTLEDSTGNGNYEYANADPTQAVYPYVPIELVARWVNEASKGLKALPDHSISPET